MHHYGAADVETWSRFSSSGDKFWPTNNSSGGISISNDYDNDNKQIPNPVSS